MKDIFDGEIKFIDTDKGKKIIGTCRGGINVDESSNREDYTCHRCGCIYSSLDELKSITRPTKFSRIFTGNYAEVDNKP